MGADKRRVSLRADKRGYDQGGQYGVRLTLLLHADLTTPSQSTRLTLASHPHVHLTLTAILARVRRSLRD